MRTKITLAFIMMAYICSAQNYNMDEYYDSTVQRAKPTVKTFGGFMKIGLGVSPTHPRLFAEATAGVSYKFVELSATGLPGIGIHVFTGKIGARFPVTKLVTVTPNIGYWTHWNEEEKIKWIGGNRFVYGVDISRRVHNNLELYTSWIDCRGGRYNAMKIGTLGIKYIF